MNNRIKFFLLSFSVLFALSCSLFSVPITPITNTPPIVSEPLQSTTASPSTIPLTPTDTPAPTSLNTSGPYILFEGRNGIWISNPDGSFPTRLSEIEVQGDLRHTISPAEDRMALVVQNDQGLDLVMVNIPGG